MFDRSAFRKLIADRGVKLKAVANAMGIEPTTLYRKELRGGDFTRSEIQKCCKFFGLDEMNYIFFAKEVAQTQPHSYVNADTKQEESA